MPPEIDSRSRAVIDTLNPKVRPVFEEIYYFLRDHFAAKGVVLKYITGTRTWKEQDALYAKGRTAPGPKVTNARGGYSNHNFGLAVDCGLFKDGDYLEDSPLYSEIGLIVSKFPQLEWGGSWRSITDEPHIEYRTGLSLAEKRERMEKGIPLVV